MSTTSEIDALRASMRSAQVAGKGQYVGEGRHVLEVDKCFVKRSSYDGVQKETYICEFKVLESSNPTHEAGSTRTYAENPANLGWLGRWKGCLLGLIGVDPAGKVPAEAETAVGDIIVALRYDDERIKLGFPENFLKGRRVRCEGMAGKSKGKDGKPGTDIVNKRWTPAS
jgi:hypothetical protein